MNHIPSEQFRKALSQRMSVGVSRGISGRQEGSNIRNNPQIDGMLERGGFLVNIQVMEEILLTTSDV